MICVAVYTDGTACANTATRILKLMCVHEHPLGGGLCDSCFDYLKDRLPDQEWVCAHCLESSEPHPCVVSIKDALIEPA